MHIRIGEGKQRKPSEARKQAAKRIEESVNEYWQNPARHELYNDDASSERDRANRLVDQAIRETGEIQKDQLVLMSYVETKDELKGDVIGTNFIAFHPVQTRELYLDMDVDDVDKFVMNPPESSGYQGVSSKPEIKGLRSEQQAPSLLVLSKPFVGWYAQENIETGQEVRGSTATVSQLPQLQHFTDTGHILDAYAERQDGRIGRVTLPVNEEAASELEKQIQNLIRFG